MKYCPNVLKSLLVLVLLLFCSADSQASFNKSSFNPILTSDAVPSWDSVLVNSESVIFDGSQYKMWYTGFNGIVGKIGFATSLNGITWNKYSGNPVLSPNISDPWEQEVGEPVVIYDGTTYRMWYTSFRPSGPEFYRIRYAQSTDGINWTKTAGFVLQSSGYSWDMRGVSNPTVIIDNGTYKMWYGANDSSGNWKIGFATSSDGLSWVKHSVPVLTPSIGETTVAQPSVKKLDNKYIMYYHSGLVVPHFIKSATSIDGINWTIDSLPILERGGFGAFDANLIGMPDILRVHNKLKLYYSGRDNAFVWRIGLAEEKLPVPYFSQTDPQWGDDQYDSLNMDMSQVGCAVTSAAMVLRHFDVKTTPGNSQTGLVPKNLNPGTLNEWLNDVKDGHFRNGVTNFVSIAKMTRKSHDLDPTNPKLEYSHHNSLSTIDTELASDRAPILKLEYPPSPSDMHFVVATGSANGTYNILDPYYADRTTMSPHYPTVLRVDKFVPANSDFSYIVAAIDESVSLILKDGIGNEVGEVTVEKPLADLVNETTSGTDPLRVLYFAKPPDGTYSLEVSSPTAQSYQLDLYLYDEQADSAVSSYKGFVSQNNNDNMQIVFDKENIVDSIVTSQISFESLLKDMHSLYSSNEIKNKGIYNSFVKKVEQAQKLAVKNKNSEVKEVLTGLRTQVENQRGNHLSEVAFNVLIPQLDTLILRY